MKVKLSMELDIPEKYYRDDEEDKNISPTDLPKLHISFVRDEIFRNLLQFSQVQHLVVAMRWMKENSPSAQSIVAEHNNWADIINESIKTFKVEPIE